MNKFIKIIIILFSLIYAVIVLNIFVADRLSFFAKREAFEGQYNQAISLIDRAILLDSFNAELYFQKFGIIKRKRREEGDSLPSKQEIFLVKKCIELRPFWPKYHLTYGLILAQKSLTPNIVTKELIQSELKKAASLKPYSDLYRKRYQEYTINYK